MRNLTEEEFLQWAADKGLALNSKYPQSAILDFQSGSDARFWVVPHKPEHGPYFLASLIDLMGDWKKCYVWRHLGSWPSPNHINPERINDLVNSQIFRGLGLPTGTADIVEFDRSEREALITLLFCTTIFGWSVGDDLYVVPDHAQQILQTDHHNVIHVSIPIGGDLQRWISTMSQEGFDLPEELPDQTFKQPSWMKSNQQPLAPAYHHAVITAFLLQFVLTPLLLLILDGGRLAKIGGCAMTGFWIGAAIIMLRRPHSPRPFDLLFIRWGYLVLLMIGIAIGMTI